MSPGGGASPGLRAGGAVPDDEELSVQLSELVAGCRSAMAESRRLAGRARVASAGGEEAEGAGPPG